MEFKPGINFRITGTIKRMEVLERGNCLVTISTSAEGQIHRQKAGGNGEDTGKEVGRVEHLQYPVEHPRGHHRRKAHEHDLFFADGIHLDLRPPPVVGVFQP